MAIEDGGWPVGRKRAPLKRYITLRVIAARTHSCNSTCAQTWSLSHPDVENLGRLSGHRAAHRGCTATTSQRWILARTANVSRSSTRPSRAAARLCCCTITWPGGQSRTSGCATSPPPRPPCCRSWPRKTERQFVLTPVDLRDVPPVQGIRR